MLKSLLVAVVCTLFVLSFSVCSFAEIGVSYDTGVWNVSAHSGSTKLNSEKPEATVVDSTKGEVRMSCSEGTNTLALENVSGGSSVVYVIAKIYTDNSDSVKINLREGEKVFSILNSSAIDSGISANVTVLFPDNSTIIMPSGSEVSFSRLAESNYQMRVVQGSVDYIDSNGKMVTLTSKDGAVFIEGYNSLPSWRKTIPDSSPATP